MPEQQQRQKAMIEFTSGKPTFDVAHLSMHVQKRLSEKGNWLEDLRPMLADGSLTTPDLDFDDFGKAGLDFCTAADGKQNAVPTFVDYWILYYNKELFEQKGVAYPKSMDEIVTAAQKLTDAAKGVYGFVSRGLKNANVPVWTSWLLGQGMETVVQGRQAAHRHAGGDLGRRAVQAAQPGVRAARHGRLQLERMPDQLRARAAPPCGSTASASPRRWRTRPSRRSSARSAMASCRKGPKAQHSAIFGDGMGIARTLEQEGRGLVLHPVHHQQGEPAQHPEDRRGLAGAQLGRSATRRSCAIPSSASSGSTACWNPPRSAGPACRSIIPVTEFRDIFGVALTNMISGADPATELKKATEAFKPVLEKSEQG